MKKHRGRILARILCLMLVFGMAAPSFVTLAASRETQEEIDRLKKEKQKAEEERKRAEQQKGSIKSQKSATENYLKELEQQAGGLSEQISILEADIQEKETAIEKKKAELEAAEEEVSRQYEDMKKRIQYMYENGQGSMMNYMSAALTGSISDVLNQAEYAMNINLYDRNMLNSYKEAKASLDQQKEELQEEQQELELLLEEAQKKKEQVAVQQKSAGSKLSEYDELLAKAAGEVSSMEELVAEKTRILNQLIQKAEEEERQARLSAAQQTASSMNNGAYIIAGDAKISRGHISLSDYELLLLATMIYCEAGNQGWEGQTAVGYVIMNRVRSALYPNSLEAVLRQSKQFEPAGSGRFDLYLKREQDPDLPKVVTQSCWDAARTVINGTSNVGDSLFFRTWRPVPTLEQNLKNNGVPYWVIRDHIFYYYWTSYSTKPKPPEKHEPEEPDEEEPDEEEPEKPKDPEPSEPTTPTEPEKPTEPTTPTEPEKPTEPTNPTEPEKPKDPDPAQPTDPTTPTEPEKPTEPTEPTDQTEPTTPTEPTDPGQSEEGSQTTVMSDSGTDTE